MCPYRRLRFQLAYPHTMSTTASAAGVTVSTSRFPLAETLKSLGIRTCDPGHVLEYKHRALRQFRLLERCISDKAFVLIQIGSVILHMVMTGLIGWSLNGWRGCLSGASVPFVSWLLTFVIIHARVIAVGKNKASSMPDNIPLRIVFLSLLVVAGQWITYLIDAFCQPRTRRWIRISVHAKPSSFDPLLALAYQIGTHCQQAEFSIEDLYDGYVVMNRFLIVQLHVEKYYIHPEGSFQ
jgi:hypothetical protein